MKRAALYVRVSSAEQRDHGLSVDSQISALTKYCADNRLQIAGIYNDAGISARKKYKARPALLQLMQDCKDKKVDIILFTKLDRWFRSVSDYYEVQRVLDAAKVPWRAIWEDYETETSAGIFKVNIMLSVAQAESDRTSERIKAVNEYKRQRGDLVVHKMPLGYVRTGPGEIAFDPDTRDAVAAIFNTYLQTYSCQEARMAAAEKGVTMSRANITRILRKEPYYGTYLGKQVPAYITQEQHNAILRNQQAYIRTPKSPSRVYIFSGLVFCALCGARMTAKCSWNSNGGEVKYYRCSGADKKDAGNCTFSKSEKKIESALVSSLNDCIARYNADAKKQNEGLRSAQGDIEKLKARLQRLKDVYIDGDIERDKYVMQADQIKAKIAELEVKTSKIRIIAPMPPDWQAMYWQLSESGKRQFWRGIIKKIIVSKSGVENVVFI